MSDRQGPVRRVISALTRPFRRKSTPEPIMPLWTTGIQEPVLAQGITIPALYAVASENLILRTVLTTLNQEMFRRGYFWEPKFVKKCDQCHEEFQHDLPMCNKCGGEVKGPDHEQLNYPQWMLQQENSMGQSFLDVMREVEYDLDVVDDAFLILVKEYYLDEKGQPIMSRVKEVVRGDPIFMRIVADKRGVRGGKYRVRLKDRVKPIYPGASDYDEDEMFDVHFVNTAGSGKTQYFIKGEVLHVSKYNPSKLYGKAPVNTLWRQAMTLTAMDNYIYTAYQKRRTPKGIISVTTDNLESMKSFWKAVDEKMERDPHYVPKVGIESSSGRGGVNWVKFMDTLEEMQYIAVRDEIRMRMAAFYGVSNVFMMDTGKSGGLNNEGMQMVVTNRAVEFGQKVYTDSLFPKLLAEMGVTDWKLALYPSEEEDEVTRLRRDEMEVNIAQRMMMLGFKPELKSEGEEDLRFVYSSPEEGQQPGMPGMMPGGMPMGGMPMQGGMPPMQGGMPPMQGGVGHGSMTMPGAQPGGEGVGLRNRGPASPQNRSAVSGSPVSSVQQRGPQPGPAQRNSKALMDARRPRGA